MLTRALRERASRCSVLLAYHGVSTSAPEDDPDNLCVTPERFTTQLGLLLDAGFTPVTTAELLDRWGDRPQPPPGHVVLTFDDGMEDNLHQALPILRAHGATGTVYVASGLLGGPNPFMAARAGRRMLTPEEVVELHAAGIEIGGHTRTHADLAALDLPGCLEEVGGGREDLERLVGTAPRTFAFPFGHYGDAALRAVREAGFEAALTVHGRGGHDPMQWRRTMITGLDSDRTFVLKVLGLFEPLHRSGPGRLARRASRPVRQARRRRRPRPA